MQPGSDRFAPWSQERPLRGTLEARALSRPCVLAQLRSHPIGVKSQFCQLSGRRGSREIESSPRRLRSAWLAFIDDTAFQRRVTSRWVLLINTVERWATSDGRSGREACKLGGVMSFMSIGNLFAQPRAAGWLQCYTAAAPDSLEEESS